MNNPVLVVFLSFLLIAVLFIPVIRINKKKEHKSIYLSLYVFFLVFVIRFLVAINADEALQIVGLNTFELLLDSIVHTLQTFSMDEDYTLYTVVGKRLLESAGYSSWAFVYGLFVSFLNVCAPILGGAMLLDILTSLFPLLKIWFHPFKHKFVFSELNESSVCLAEDICHDKKYKKLLNSQRFEGKPLIVFTDAYVDDESEASSELLNRAKRIGAVCVKTDLLNICLFRSKSVTYLLMDSVITNNLTTLSTLLNQTEKKHLYPFNDAEAEPCTKIFIFVQHDEESATAQKLYNQSRYSEHVVLRIIRDYRNAAINLMNDVPLFLPLLYKNETKRKDLYITILGSGNIAEEVFKALYWCGQMPEVKLHVNILSKDAADFEARMKEAYPEMMECCDCNSQKLIVFKHKPNSSLNAPYIETLHFTPIEDVKRVSTYPTEILKYTDYYVIALGSDEENALMSTLLSDRLSKMRLTKSCPEKNVIVPAIFNSSLAKAISITKPDVRKNETYIFTFATFESRFSCKNVFMADFTETSLSTENLYNRAHQLKMQKDEYTYWANLVRTIHAPYKLFGFGFVETVGDDLSEDKYQIKTQTTLEQIPDQPQAWIEHRRWNAFMRTEGFSCPTEEEFAAYFDLIGTHKNIPRKLHRCLVECCIDGTPELPDDESFDKSFYECLDEASMVIYKAYQEKDGRLDFYGEGLRKAEYKQWDYKQYDAGLKSLLNENN